MIRQTLFAISDNDAKPIHTGSLFEITNNTMRMVSVDGYRLAMRTEPVMCSEELKFVVPGKALAELLKLLKDEEQELQISVGRRHIIFRIGNYTVLSSLLEGEFLDYRAAIPAAGSTEVVVKTRSFIDSVDHRSGRVRGNHRSFRLWKINFDEHAGMSGYTDFRILFFEWKGCLSYGR